MEWLWLGLSATGAPSAGLTLIDCRKQVVSVRVLCVGASIQMCVHSAQTTILACDLEINSKRTDWKRFVSRGWMSPAGVHARRHFHLWWAVNSGNSWIVIIGHCRPLSETTTSSYNIWAYIKQPNWIKYKSIWGFAWFGDNFELLKQASFRHLN